MHETVMKNKGNRVKSGTDAKNRVFVVPYDISWQRFYAKNRVVVTTS